MGSGQSGLPASTEYLTFTGSLAFLGGRVTRVLQTPSPMRAGQESGLERTSSGSERIHTDALRAVEAA